MRFRDDSKWWTFACDVLRASRRFDRGFKQSKLLFPFLGSRTPHRWPPKDHPGPALPQGRYSLFILTSQLGFEPFCSPQDWLGLVDFWLRALECCRRSCTPSTSGARLKVGKPATDPQRNCLDWCAHQVWSINSVRKTSGNIFEGWWFFCYIFTFCWLLSWRTKLKLTPSTKLAYTKWKTSKTALKTDLQSWPNFQLALVHPIALVCT